MSDKLHDVLKLYHPVKSQVTFDQPGRETIELPGFFTWQFLIRRCQVLEDVEEGKEEAITIHDTTQVNETLLIFLIVTPKHIMNFFTHTQACLHTFY